MTDSVKWLREQAANDFTCEAKLLEIAKEMQSLIEDCIDMSDEVRFLRSFSKAVMADNDYLRDALSQYRDDLLHPPTTDSRDRRIEMINNMLERKGNE